MWDVCRNESGYVSDTSGGGRVGGNGMSEYNIHTPDNNDWTFRSLKKPEIKITSESNLLGRNNKCTKIIN